MKYLTEKDIDKLTEYLGYYLSETVENLTIWDCKHLAMNILKELRIVEPQWWNMNLELKKKIQSNTKKKKLK